MRQVKITSNGYESLGTKIVDAETGAELHNVFKLQIVIEPGELVKASAEIIASCEIDAVLTYWMMDPSKPSELRQLKSVTFDDGEVVVF